MCPLPRFRKAANAPGWVCDVARARIAMGLTQEVLVEKLGFDLNTYRKFEVGEPRLTEAEALKLKKFLSLGANTRIPFCPEQPIAAPKKAPKTTEACVKKAESDIRTKAHLAKAEPVEPISKLATDIREIADTFYKGRKAEELAAFGSRAETIEKMDALIRSPRIKDSEAAAILASASDHALSLIRDDIYHQS